MYARQLIESFGIGPQTDPSKSFNRMYAKGFHIAKLSLNSTQTKAEVSFISIESSNPPNPTHRKKLKHAGAELCQAQSSFS